MKHTIGAQTIPWGEIIKDRMGEILEFLAGEGYRGVETGIRHFDTDNPDYYRKLYDRTGLTPLGLHSGGQFWEPDAAEQERRKLHDSIAFAATVGFQNVVVSGNKAETVDSMKTAAQTYGQLGRACRKQGLRLAYHNHNWELANDAAILRTLLDETDPGDVSLVLDVAWAHVGGVDLSGLLKRVGDRVAYLHIKDVAGEAFCELGTGEVDLPHVVRLAADSGIQWLVIEQDYTELTPEESMRRNMSYLRSTGVAEISERPE